MRPLFFCVPLVLLAACQAPVNAPVEISYSGEPAFGPITRDQVLALRQPVQDLKGDVHAAQFAAGYDAPAGMRAGNWEFTIAGGGGSPENTGVMYVAPLAADQDPVAVAKAVATDAVEVPPVEGGPRVFTTQAVPGALTFREGLVIRVLQAPVPIATDGIISAEAARASFQRAYDDPTVPVSEDLSGVDHFTGLPFKNADAYPKGCLEIVPEAGKTLSAEVEKNVEWMPPVLERKLGKRVWRIAEDYDYICKIGPTLETLYDKKIAAGLVIVHGAGGYVDAETGAVIRLRRLYQVHGVLGL